MATTTADPYAYLGAQRNRALGTAGDVSGGAVPYTPNSPPDIQSQLQSQEDANMAKWGGMPVDQYLAQNAQQRQNRTAAGYLNAGDPVRDPSVLQAQSDQYGTSTTSPTSEGAAPSPNIASLMQTLFGSGQTPGAASTTPGAASTTPGVTVSNPPSQSDVQNALYARASEAINLATDRQRQQLLEGTFGTGVGNSTIQTELQGRLAQEQNDALSRAAMDALTGAGAETRAGQQLQLQQQALAQQGGQFGQSMGLQYANLSQQAQQAEANRQAAMQLLQTQIGGQSGLLGQQQTGTAALSAQQAAQALAAQMLGQQFTGGQNTQAQQAAMQQLLASIAGQGGLLGQQQTFTAQQNTQAQQAAMQQLLASFAGQGGLLGQQQTFQGAQNTQAQQAALQQLLTSIYGQTALQRGASTQQLAMLMQQFYNTQSLLGQQQLGTGLTTGLGGIAALLAPYITSLGQPAGGG